MDSSWMHSGNNLRRLIRRIVGSALSVFECPFARDNANADVDADANANADAGRSTWDRQTANSNNNNDDNDKWQTKNIFSKSRKKTKANNISKKKTCDVCESKSSTEFRQVKASLSSRVCLTIANIVLSPENTNQRRDWVFVWSTK